MRQFHLQIATPDGLVFDGQAIGLLVRTDGGDIEILAGHEDYFATLGTGRAKLTTEEGSKEAAASGGFLSVRGGEVMAVFTTFEFSDAISMERAKKAKEKAEEILRNHTDKKELSVAEAKLKRAINRINIAKNN